MGLAADFTAVHTDTPVPIGRDDAARFFRALRDGSPGGPIAGSGNDVGTIDPFVASANGSDVLPLGAGSGVCGGIFGRWLPGNAGAHATAHASLERIDTIALEVDWVANTTELVIVQGTPGAGAPTLTRSATTVWQEPLYDVSIPGNGSTPTISSGDVTNRMLYLGIGPWVPITFGTGFGNFAGAWPPAAYRVEHGSMVRTRGLLEATSARSAGDPICNLPTHLVPATSRVLVAEMGSPLAHASILLDSGQNRLETRQALGSGDFLSFELVWDLA